MAVSMRVGCCIFCGGGWGVRPSVQAQEAAYPAHWPPQEEELSQGREPASHRPQLLPIRPASTARLCLDQDHSPMSVRASATGQARWPCCHSTALPAWLGSKASSLGLSDCETSPARPRSMVWEDVCHT